MNGEMHDFGDGLVPAHRHANGNGWVDDRATVDAASEIREPSTVSDSTVRYSTVRYSTVRGSKVSDSTVRSSKVSDSTVLKHGDFVSICGLAFSVGVTPQNASIGCQTKTHDEWLKVTKARAVKMGLPAKEWLVFSATVRAAIAAVQAAQK